jgi:hypothetical protein
MERWSRWRRSPTGRRTTPSVLTGAILRRSISAVRFSSAGPEAVTSLRGRATLAPAGAHLQSGRTMRSALLAAAVTCLALAASAEAQPREPESLPAGRAPPGGAAASLARSLRPLPRAAAAGRGAGAAGAPALWPARAWLRTAVVRAVPRECARRLLLPRSLLLPLMREAAPAPLRRVAVQGSAGRSRPRTSCASVTPPPTSSETPSRSESSSTSTASRRSSTAPA